MLIATDPLSLVFVACFLFGLIFLIATAILGQLGSGHAGDAQGAHGISHAGQPSVHAGAHVGVHSGVHGIGHGSTANHAASAHGATNGSTQGDVFVSLLGYINITSIVLFLLGFGFFGYVLHNTIHLLAQFTLVLAGVSGLVIAVLLLVLLNRLFGDSEGATIQDVSDRTGMLGKVSITIQENSLGEIIYISPGGMRKSIPARSVDGRRIERDQEVVVINYQHGVAEVDTWEHFFSEEEAARSQAHDGVLATPNSPDPDELAQLRALLDESSRQETELVKRKDLQKE